MSKQTPTVEWIVAKSEADWERLCPLTPPTGEFHRQRNRSYWGIGTLLLLLVGVGGWVWRMEQKVISQPPAKVTPTVQPMPATVTQGRAVLATTVISDIRSSLHKTVQNHEPAAVWDVEFSKLELWGQRAIVSIVTKAQSAAPAYRQTLFYQRTAAGWVQTEPDATLWGPERTQETPYFVFHFRQNDAPAVMVVAPRLDALYTTLHRNFGLLLTPGDAKQVIDVRVTQDPGYALPWFAVADDPLIVASPARYLAPVTLTDVALLEQTLALPLLAAVLTRASQQYGIQESRQTMLSALRLWHVWEMDLPLAAWREEIVPWLYADLTVATHERLVVLPQRYTDLCLTHKLWLWGPAQLGIPLACTDLDRDSWSFSAWGPHDPPLHLQQIALQAPPEEANPVSSHRGQRVALATLIAYAVATYGRETLPVLVAGLGRYESWETLIPAVYGVSPDEFEAGWQAYLAVQYEIAPIGK